MTSTVAKLMSDSETLYLHRIARLPLDADTEIFRHYPAFKLGVTRSVRYYAQRLLPLVKDLIASDSGNGDWIFTSPALAADTPAGANLLCRELFDLRMRERDDCNSRELSLVDIHYDNERTAAIDYAKLELADRLRERERLSQRLIRNPDFYGRPVLFVNDISVTGAQQQAMQEYFERGAATCVRWLYLIVVDPAIGKTDPRIEWRINFVPFEDLLRMVSREEIQFTGKCVLKLMQLSVAELDRVLQALNRERRTRLWELASRNGFASMEGFREQVNLMRSCSS